MTEEEKNSRKADLFDIVGQFAAFLTIIVYICLIINANWPFISEGDLLNVMTTLKTYAPLVLVLIVGLEFAQERNFILKLIIYIAIAAIVVFQFFPGTWENFVGIINTKV